MKRIVVILAVVALFLVLVVAPVSVGSAAKAAQPVSPECTEAVAVTEAIAETEAPAASETVETFAAEFDDVGDERPTEVVLTTDVDVIESDADDFALDEYYADECAEAVCTEEGDYALDVYYSGGVYSYSDSDLDLLARLIYVENGCEWMPDWVQLYTGSVVLNRVNSPLYADTIEGVIYEPGQYVPSALYNSTPDERTYENARLLLEGGSVLPAEVMGQNGFNAGDGTYAVYYDEVLGSTEYFTYVYG